jgi:hypothetical protein
MATYTASHAKTFTLSNGVVDTVVLTGIGNHIAFAVTANHKPIYFTLNGPGQELPDPTVGGDNCYCVDYQSVFSGPWTGGPVTLKLIAAGNPTLTVMLFT